MPGNEIIFYMRFVKTASSTITEHLRKNYTGYSCDENKLSHENVRFRSGHLVHYGKHLEYPGKSYKYMTTLRDPTDWLVSCYNQDESRKRTGRSFKEWCADGAPNSVLPQSNVKNKMTAFACWLFNTPDYKGCLEVLEKCWFVGLAENLDIELKLLCEYLGINSDWKNYRVSGEYDVIENIKIDKLCVLTNELRRWIYENNPIDVDLYNYAKRRNIETRKNLLKAG